MPTVPDTCEPWECDDDITDAAIMGLARRASESHIVFVAIDCESGAAGAACAVADQAENDFEHRFIFRFERTSASILAELLYAGKIAITDIPKPKGES